MNKPIYIECDITLQCNLKCIRCNRFCDISKNLNSEMTLCEIDKILNALLKYQINRFRIMGGEPTVNPHIFEICNLILNSKNIKDIEILTNFINYNILSKIHLLFPTIKIINLDGNSSINIKYKKFNRHINIYLSPFYERMEISNAPCNIYNNFYDRNNCGIHIFKDQTIKYMYSSVCSAVIKLLGNDKLFFNSVDELLKSNQSEVFNKICKHCMMGNKNPVLIKNNISISLIFRSNIENLKLK